MILETYQLNCSIISCEDLLCGRSFLGLTIGKTLVNYTESIKESQSP